jgi:amidase
VPSDLATLDATAQAELVRSGKASARELVEAAIARIEKVNPSLNAVNTTSFERALERAESDAAAAPFHGVPFLMKDLDGSVAGEPYHCGMNFLKGSRYVAGHDSHLAAKLEKAGFITLGKTNTPELGLTATTEPAAYGPSRNPWNVERSPGGSSGGSAAAVAAGMVPAAHASDGGGSIRIPASECGLVGLKPSRGRVSLGPDYGEYWQGFVISHAVTRSVRDSAAILDCIHGAMPGDPYAAPTPARSYREEVGASCRGLRIGLMTALPGGGRPHAECVKAVEHAGEALQRAAHHVELSHPAALDDNVEATRNFMLLVTCWVRASLDEWSATTGETIREADVEPNTYALAEMGRAVGAPDYIDTCKWVSRWTRRMAAWWDDGCDVLVTPTIALPPPELGYLAPPPGDPLGNVDRVFGLMAYTPQFNMTGQPAISLPLHWSADGLPIGVQLVAAYGREDVLFRVAAQLEEILPWRDRRPPVHA